jgi:transposase InsO family protein
MPWREVSAMDERREFVRLAMMEGANRRELCRRFGISADVGYKWLARWRAGDVDLGDRSRRPHVSPRRSSEELEGRVLDVRDAHPAWGARKIVSLLARRGAVMPAVSTVHEILRRHGRIDPLNPSADPAPLRFEREAPNQLWQMDFKGWMTLVGRERCHPLTIIDDHSRFVPCLKACANQEGQTVQAHLKKTFVRHGLPEAIFVDNGSPWGDASGERWTWLGVWLLKLGVDLIYSRPFHPQSRGKNERFHRTLKAEVFALRRFHTFAEVQRALDGWRDVYNFERPHEAIGQKPPATRWRPSPRRMPKHVPEVEYDLGE